MPWHDSNHGGINHHHDDDIIDNVDQLASEHNNESMHEIQDSNSDSNNEDHNDSHEHNWHHGHNHEDYDEDDYDNEDYSDKDDNIDYIPSWSDDRSHRKRVKYDQSKRHRIY